MLSANSTTSVKDCAVSDSLRVSPEYGLHGYQRQVVRDLLSILIPRGDRGAALDRRVVAHLPTGAGKTRIASYVACQLLSRHDDALMVWLASTEELCDQAADELARAWSHLGNREVQLHRYWGNSSLILQDLSEGFLVAGLGKLRATAFRSPTGLLASISERAAGIIFDEAHQSIASTYEFVTEQLATHQPPLLGLTATPGRKAQPGDDDRRLAEMFHSNKVSIDPRGHPDPVTYLISNDYLADPEFIQIHFESDIVLTGLGEDYDQQDLDALGQDMRRNEVIVNTTIQALERNRRVIIFCPSVQSAQDCATDVRQHGIRAEAITASTPADKRQSIIGAFRSDSGGNLALFNYGVLTAGFDAPRTRCAIIARPTTSLVLYSQMVGRAMRGTQSGGNKTCEIYTVVDTSVPGFRSLAEAFSNWEEVWRNN